MSSTLFHLFRRRSFTVPLLALVVLALSASLVLAVTVGTNTINFVGRTFDGTNSTFTYEVTSGSGPALSHWVLEYCLDPSLIVSITDGGDTCAEGSCYELGYDPNTQVTGIKFEENYADGETRTIQIVLQGFIPLTSEVGTDNYDYLNLGTKNGGTNVTAAKAIDGPTCDAGSVPVTVSFFRALREGNAVNFAWSTATEVGNLGYNLYALTDKGLVQVNDELIAVEGMDSLRPQDYTATTKDIAADTFFIGDVSIEGKVQFHGPFKLGETYGEKVSVEPIDWKAIRSETETLAAQRLAVRTADLPQQTAKASLDLAAAGGIEPTGRDDVPLERNISGFVSGFPVVEFKVDRDSLYRVTYEQLRDAGLDLAGVPSAKIALTNRGAGVPIFVKSGKVFGPGAFIEFYGQALSTLYTNTNVYQLHVDASLARRITWDTTQPNLRARPAGFYMETVTVDNNVDYSPSSPTDDPWYDTRLRAQSGRVASATRNFALDGYVPNAAAATLTVDVWGSSSWTQHNPDHHILAKVNGTTLADVRFDGVAANRITAEVPTALLDESNTLTLEVPGDTGVTVDQIMLDRYSITYPRAFHAREGGLTFKAAANLFTVSHLPTSHVAVYRLTDDGLQRLTRVRVSGANGSYSASFRGSAEPATYLVSTVQAIATPSISPARPAVDITSGSAQFLMISHPNFIPGLQPLVAARQAQGITVRVVDVEDVYAQFAHGIFDPQAIREYIRHAAQNMGTEYVLLVGGDTYDYHNYLGQGSLSFIPSLYARTGVYGNFAPADPLFTDFDGNQVPDLAIGRFPVRTTAELDAMVAKTLQYDKKDYGGTAIFTADGSDPLIPFTAISERLAGELGDSWTVEKAYIDQVGVATARSTLLDALNRGVALTSFFGHSGTTVWTFRGLFDINDAASLMNADKPTVVTQWGCWNTYYVAPDYNTLGHKFLLTGNRGAAAVLGASTLTSPTSESRLGQLVTPRLVQPGVTIGAAVQAAKTELANTNPEMVDVLLGWTLLGDPTLVVQR